MKKQDKVELFELLTPHMRTISKVISNLGELNNRWGVLSAIAAVSCDNQGGIIRTMEETRAAFRESECDLSRQLLKEELQKVVSRLTSYAQVTADILVRNLFERTADVGFLATDADIRAFLLKDERTSEDREKLVARLTEYRNKYTVYDEVMIIGPDRKVLARLTSGTAKQIQESWLGQTLGQDGFVETFGKTALLPKKDRALLYSQRITDSSGTNVIGALVLSFDFEGEMAGIFRDLRKADDPSVTLLLDTDGVVIATSDADHIPIGRRMTKISNDKAYGIIDSGGQEYIAVTKLGRPYEGYPGPGWSGHDMAPITRAFRGNSSQALLAIDPELLKKVLRHADALCPRLTEIVAGTSRINDSLRRVVWDGQIMATRDQGSTNAFKAMLKIVSATGSHTSAAFNHAITELRGTVISSNLRAAEGVASLMINLMDRNLYERACDCRWWALISDIRAILAEGDFSPANKAKILKILEYINSLYTVYPRILVYDANGVIVAASNYGNDSTEVVEKKLEGDLVSGTFATQTTQQYRVSPFEATWLYGGRPTYVYSAAIRSMDDPTKVVGGIGIVFDSGPQFQKMLDDCLPPGAFGLFVEKSSSRTIATSKESGHGIGDILRIDRTFFDMPAKSGMSRLVLYRGCYYVVGCHASRGYREYKNSGDYVNDVLAFVFMPIGKEDQSKEPVTRNVAYQLTSMKESGIDFGTFFVGDELYAVRSDIICSTVDASQIQVLPGSKNYIVGTVPFREENSVPVPVSVVWGEYAFSEKKITDSPKISGCVIVLRAVFEGKPNYIGLLVDGLESVISVPISQVKSLPEVFQQDSGYVSEALMLAGKEVDTVILGVIKPEALISVVLKK